MMNQTRKRFAGNGLVHTSSILCWMWLGVCCVAPVHAVVLFDASLSTPPSEQGWIPLSNPLVPVSTQRLENNLLILDTQADLSEQAGFFSQVPFISHAHPQAPEILLDADPLAIDLRLRVVDAVDIPDTDPRYAGQRNRGGFSVIAIADDLRGIELHFQSDRILVLNDTDTAFPLGEVTSHNNSESLTSYRLTLEDSGYRLETSSEVLLNGRLRDYSKIAPQPPFDFPYVTPNFFFFGDDSPRGGGVTQIARFAAAPLGDCSHDGFLDAQDFACFKFVEERNATLSKLGLLAGDLDADGEVGFSDFLEVAKNFGNNEADYAMGNINLQDGVDFADFLVLANNFGKERAITTVPEPGTSASFALALAAIAYRISPRNRARDLRS